MSTKTKFTPGPWWVWGDRVGARGCTIAEIIPQEKIGEANHALIVSAPDLYAELERVSRIIRRRLGGDARGEAQRINAVLARARGER